MIEEESQRLKSGRVRGNGLKDQEMTERQAIV
jgi:hypothetical protein